MRYKVMYMDKIKDKKDYNNAQVFGFSYLCSLWVGNPVLQHWNIISGLSGKFSDVAIGIRLCMKII